MGRGHHKVLAEEEAAASSVLAVVHVQLQQRHVGPRVRRRLVAPDDSTCVAWGGGSFILHSSVVTHSGRCLRLLYLFSLFLLTLIDLIVPPQSRCL